MKIDGRIVALAFMATIAAYAIAWALSEQEIWSKVFEPATNTIRVKGI